MKLTENLKTRIDAFFNNLTDEEKEYLIENYFNKPKKQLNLHVVVGRSEQLPCPHCGQLEPCAGNSPETCYHPKVCQQGNCLQLLIKRINVLQFL